MEIPEPPVLKEPDRQHGERQEETVDEQAEAVEPVKLGLFLVDAKLRREEILFGHGVRDGGVRDGGGHDGVISLRVELEIANSPAPALSPSHMRFLRGGCFPHTSALTPLLASAFKATEP